MASSGRRIAQQVLGAVGRAAVAGARSFLREREREQSRGRPRSRASGGRAPSGRTDDAAVRGAAYPGDFDGVPAMEYSPKPDGRPDPGEVVWTWVPYEEDHRQGKDRPVLLVGRDGRWLLALPLTSKDHDRDAAQEARSGRHWVDVGSGAWDQRGRPSEVRLDRVVRVDPDAIRREGAVLAQDRFEDVVRAVRGLRR